MMCPGGNTGPQCSADVCCHMLCVSHDAMIIREVVTGSHDTMPLPWVHVREATISAAADMDT